MSAKSGNPGRHARHGGAVRLRLMLGGDVMTGRGLDQVLPHPGDPWIRERFMSSALGYVALAEARAGPLPRRVAPAHVWGDLLAEIDRRAPDLRIVNLETAITTSDRPAPKGINYRMHPANTPVLTAAGLDACVLANNHVLDWGPEGLTETLETLEAAGLPGVGAGRTAEAAARPALLPVPGKGRVILIALGDRSSGIPESWAATDGAPGVAMLPRDPDAAAALVRRAAACRRPGDVVVVSLHWGPNFGYDIAPARRRLAQRLIEAGGADLVHGHSSHHPLGVELFRGRLIIHGCGDLLNDYEGIGGHEDFRPDLVLAWFADLDPDTGRLAALEMAPFRIAAFRLQAASEDERAWLAARMDRECRRLGARVARAPGGGLRLVLPV
jgi:poly-gamma-glutamate synthesis protein (capsule biosynthesis protein)